MTVTHLTPVPDIPTALVSGADPVSDPRPASWAGLTPDDTVRVEAAMTAAYADTTRAA